MRTSTDIMRDVGGLPLTIVAYTTMALIAAWWFLRFQAGVVNPRLHAVVSIIFGLLWPVSLPWHVCVHTIAGMIAKYRLRRLDARIESPPASVTDDVG